MDDEFDLFAYSKVNEQTFEGKGHALLIVNNAPTVVGITASHSETKLARFEDGTPTDNWHGYPAIMMNMFNIK